MRPGDDVGVIPILARAAREVEAAVQKGPLKPANRARFQVAALLLREERARVKTDKSLSDSERSNEQKRLDGLAGILAKTAARDTSLIGLLADDAPVTAAAKTLRRDLLLAAGVELSPDELVIAVEPKPIDKQVEKQVVPASVRQMQMSNPFLAPDFSAAQAKTSTGNRLANWELIEPLFRSFEVGAGGGAATMELPEARSLTTRGDLELMRHQARFVEEVAFGPPHVPARRRAGPRQDGAGAACGRSIQFVSAAGGRAERREDELGARGRAVDARAHRDRRAR